MTNKAVVAALCASIALIGGAVGAVAFLLLRAAHSDGENLREELALAKGEGIPTSWEEFAKTVPTAKSAENAAPFYKKLKSPSSVDAKVLADLDFHIGVHPNGKTIALAEQFLSKQSEALSIVDQASKLPGCSFDRDWTQGVAVLLRELAPMKNASKLLALRASVKAAKGDIDGALADIHETGLVAGHVAIEGGSIDRLSSDSIRLIAMRRVATWAFEHPDQPRYRNTLRQMLENWRAPDLRQMNRDQLPMMMQLAEKSLTERGRKDLGLGPEDVSPAAGIETMIGNQSQGRIDMVRAVRHLWKVLGEPSPVRSSHVDDVQQEIEDSLDTFPVGQAVYDKLIGDQTKPWLYDENWAGRKELYTAALRALSMPSPPKRLDVGDLTSPMDGKAMTYSFDGKQMVFTLDGFDEPDRPDGGKMILKIPPDPPKQ